MATPGAGATLGAIAGRFGGELVGSPDTVVRQVATLEEAGPGDISFLANPKYRGQLATTRAGAVIVGERDRDATASPRIVTRNPYAYFARVAAFLNPGPARPAGRHPSASVAEGASVDASAAIGPQAVIGEGAVIGARCVIGAGAIVGDGAEIGEDSVLHPRAVIYPACVLGRRVIVHSGAVIGADGFGFAPEGGRWLKVPQIGRVVIGDDVEIGANTTIDRGAIGDTVIEEGAKIDNLVQIAHNCRIGAFTVIAGCAGIAGSTRIGRNCRLGGAAMVVGHIEIGDGVDVAGGTLVSKSIDKPGMYTSVFPFMPHRDWLRNAAHLRRLDALADSVRRLERSLEPDQEE